MATCIERLGSRGWQLDPIQTAALGAWTILGIWLTPSTSPTPLSSPMRGPRGPVAVFIRRPAHA
eukprot:8378140-Heterocapsa_arctica.AAC.1